jgi:hypothetical protein
MLDPPPSRQPADHTDPRSPSPWRCPAPLGWSRLSMPARSTGCRAPSPLIRVFNSGVPSSRPPRGAVFDNVGRAVTVVEHRAGSQHGLRGHPRGTPLGEGASDVGRSIRTVRRRQRARAGVPSSTILGPTRSGIPQPIGPTIVEDGNRGEGTGERARRSYAGLTEREAPRLSHAWSDTDADADSDAGGAVWNPGSGIWLGGRGLRVFASSRFTHRRQPAISPSPHPELEGWYPDATDVRRGTARNR